MANHLRSPHDRSGPDCLVSFLCPLDSPVVNPGRLRRILRPKIRFDIVARFLQRRRRHVCGVGAHVGNQADRTLGAYVQTFVQLLRHNHSAARGEPELPRRLLLKSRSDERGRGTASRLTLAHRVNSVFGPVQVRGEPRRLIAIGYLYLLALALERVQSGLELDALLSRTEMLRQPGVNRPVFHRHESTDLAFAVNHQSKRDRLHAPGGQPSLHLAPQHRTQPVAHEPVQQATRLLSVYQIVVQLPRMVERFLDCLPRYFVENYPLRLIHGYLGRLDQVPGYRFAFPVRVGRQVNRARALRALGQLSYDLALVVHHPVGGREAVFLYFYAHLGLGQVSHMSHRRLGDVLVSKEPLDGPCFGGRFYYYEVLSHIHLTQSDILPKFP